MNDLKTHCPKCGKELPYYRVNGTLEIFCAQDPMEGLDAYGPYPVQKDVICDTKSDLNRWVHIRFEDGDEHLVIHSK